MESAGTVEKAVDVLFHLHTARAPQGVTAIGQALGMPKSSTHRLLSALGRRGLVAQNKDRAAAPPSKGGNDDVEITVVVKIGCPGVCDTWQPIEERPERECPFAFVPTDDDAPNQFVARDDIAEVADQQICLAVAVQVRDVDTRRVTRLANLA